MGRDGFQSMSVEQGSKSLALPLKELRFPLQLLPRIQEYRGLTGRMEALSPQCRWSSLVVRWVMVVVEAPILSEAHGPRESSQVGGYLMKLAKMQNEKM